MKMACLGDCRRYVSALIAVMQSEAGAERIEEILVTEDQVFISAATLIETLIVALRKNLREELEKFHFGIGIEIMPHREMIARMS